MNTKSSTLLSPKPPNIPSQSSITTKENIINIVIALVVIAVLAGGGYFVYKKYFKKCPDGQVKDKNDNCAPQCDSGKIWSDQCQSCIDSCGNFQEYDCTQKQCVCKGSNLIMMNGSCYCNQSGFPTPNSDGTCPNPGCASGFKCSWSGDDCYQSTTGCSYVGSINTENGTIKSGTMIPVSCGNNNTCINTSSQDFSKLINYDSSVLDKMCQANSCSCSGSGCKYPDCTGQKFSGWKNDGCFIEQNCSYYTSKWANIMQGTIDKKCLVLQKDNSGGCVELSYNQVKNICELDQNGCKYGYTFDKNTGMCVNNSNNQNSYTPSGTGCRNPDDNAYMDGYVCTVDNLQNILVPNITLITTTRIDGTFYLQTQDINITSKIQLWEFAIFSADAGQHITNNASVFSSGLFTTEIIAPTVISGNTYPTYSFSINLEPAPAGNQQLINNSFYRILLYGYNQQGYEYIPICASVSNGALDLTLIGDILPVTIDDSPSGPALSLMINPTSSDVSSIMTQQNLQNIITNYNFNTSSNSQSQTGDFGIIPKPYLNYGLATCSEGSICWDSNLNIANMLGIVAWDTTNISQYVTKNYPGNKIVYYVQRLDPPPTTTYSNIMASSLTSQNKAFIIDKQPVNTTVVYLIASVIVSSTFNDSIPVSSDIYESAYQKGMASAPFMVTMTYPKYTKELCYSIKTGYAPGFYVLSEMNEGVCELAKNLQDNRSYKDWYCNVTKGSFTGSPQINNISSISDLYVWDDGAQKCLTVNPNYQAKITNYNEVTAQVSQNNLSGTGSYGSWATGVNVELNASCGCIGDPSSGSVICPPINGNANSYFTVGNKGTSGYANDYDLERSTLVNLDAFGEMSYPAWQSSTGGAYSTIVQNLYSCPLDSQPGYFTQTCAPDDDLCNNLKPLLNCSQNNCGLMNPAENPQFKNSYGNSIQWWPNLANAQSLANQGLCNGNGTFSLDKSQSNWIGKCTCSNPAVYDAKNNCIPFKEMPNCAQYGINPTNGERVCTICKLERSDLKNVGGYNYNKLVPIGDPNNNQEGCTVNYNPWAWADVLGSASHQSSNDGRNCTELANKTCRYNANSGYIYNTYDACCMDASGFENLKTKSNFQGQNSAIPPYDFTTLDPTLTITQPLVGPYTQGVVNHGEPNSLYFIAPDYLQPMLDGPNAVPYFNSIFGSQITAIQASGMNPYGGASHNFITINNDDPNPVTYNTYTQFI